MADYDERDDRTMRSPWWVSAVVVVTFFVIGWFANDVYNSYNMGTGGTGIPQVGVGGGPLQQDTIPTPTIWAPTTTPSPTPNPS